MRIALVTTPSAVGAPARDEGALHPAALAIRALLPHLRARAELELFVEPGRQGRGPAGERLRSLTELAPRAFDQLLYALGNERRCGFMLPAIRALGGTVVLHEWELGEAARGAYASLERGGWRGLGRALAEGGLVQARAWRAQRTRRRPHPPEAAAPLEPAFNRSAVRFADAFLVHVAALRERILAERNEHTPIALMLPGPLGTLAGGADEGDSWEQIAQAYLEALERFPHARSARRSLVALAFRARAAARQARQEGRAQAARPQPAPAPAERR